MRLRLALVLAAALAGLAALWWGGAATGLSHWAAGAQREFQNAMARAIRALQAGEPWALATLCTMTFAYGFVHALGPGHGKVILGGVALASRATLWRMAALSLASALAQGMTAILLVAAGVKLLGWASSDAVGLSEDVLAPASYAAITAIGLYLVWRGVSALRTTSPRSHDHDEGCGCGHAHGPTLEQADAARGLCATAALIGSIAIRPCTGALFLLVIAWRFDLVMAGILAVLAMALGTAVLNAGIAGAAVLFRRGLNAGTGGALAEALPLFQIAGGVLIAALSLTLLWPMF